MHLRSIISIHFLNRNIDFLGEKYNRTLKHEYAYIAPFSKLCISFFLNANYPWKHEINPWKHIDEQTKNCGSKVIIILIQTNKKESYMGF